MVFGIFAALILTVLGAVFDFYTTKRAVGDNPKRFHESNPIMRWVIQHSGIWGMAAVKLALCAFIFWAVLSFRSWPVNLAGIVVGLVWLGAGWRNRRLLARAAIVLLASGVAMAADQYPTVRLSNCDAPPLVQKGQVLGAVTLLAGNETGIGIGWGFGYRHPSGIIYLAQLTYQELDGTSGAITYQPYKKHPAVRLPYDTPTRETWGLAVTLAFPIGQ